jgi:hypothetical protein
MSTKTKNVKLHFFLTKYYTKSDLQKNEEVLSTYYEIISIHYRYIGLVLIRETREGWPLLTVETEVIGDSKSTNERGPPWLVRWSCLAAPVGPRTKYIFFPHRTLFQCRCPHCPESWAFSRAGSPVSKYVSLVLIRQEYLY